MDAYLFFGQYRSNKAFLANNKIKYTTICCVLDYFCTIEGVTCPASISRQKLEDLIFQKTTIKDKLRNRQQVDSTIISMVIMGLIQRDTATDMIYLGDEGRKAYINQTYHIVAADLYEAAESRRVANWALIIAVISLVATAGFFIFENSLLTK